MGSTIGITDFLDSPKAFDQNEVETYLLDKVTTMDNEANGGRSYQGFAKAELYEINNDYVVNHKNKILYHLPLEYDCCSGCLEQFPHRVYYSEQSFQEEGTDNYRAILPNNYRDIEGETGDITDIFRIQNNLYIHTEEALWHLPQNIQERITGEVTSFIGTGEFFSIPPRKIVDDSTGNSAGCNHKWATLKTPYGVIFVCELQGTVYKFNGNQLEPISSNGLFNWFKENLNIKYDEDFYTINSLGNPSKNNPSNSFGTGYISTYDTEKERIIITKKDFGLPELNSDYAICTDSGDTVIFRNFSQTIQNEESNGWRFIGVEDCKLKFERDATETRLVEVQQAIPNNADIIVQMDMTGSFSTESRSQIRNAVLSWKDAYTSINPLWTGNIYFFEYPSENQPVPASTYSERWLNILQFIEDGNYFYEYNYLGVASPINTSVISNNIVSVGFINEAAPLGFANEIYHEVGIFPEIPSPGPRFGIDYNSFINLYNTRINNGGSFKGLL